MSIRPLKVIVMGLAGILLSSTAMAEHKRIECWIGDKTSGYDITFDLATRTAEITRIFLDESGKDAILAGKIEEFPSVLRFLWQEKLPTPGLTFITEYVLEVDRKTLNGSYKSIMSAGGIGDSKTETASCMLKKVQTRSNKI